MLVESNPSGSIVKTLLLVNNPFQELEDNWALSVGNG
jgi:hypothetical protein